MNFDEIKFTDLELSTITVEGKLSNVKFNLKNTTEYLISKINSVIKINKIQQEEIDKLNLIELNNFDNFIKNIIINDFTLFELIIPELYKYNIRMNELQNDYNDYKKGYMNIIIKLYKILYLYNLIDESYIKNKQYNKKISNKDSINNIDITININKIKQKLYDTLEMFTKNKLLDICNDLSLEYLYDINKIEESDINKLFKKEYKNNLLSILYRGYDNEIINNININIIYKNNNNNTTDNYIKQYDIYINNKLMDNNNFELKFNEYYEELEKEYILYKKNKNEYKNNNMIYKINSYIKYEEDNLDTIKDLYNNLYKDYIIINNTYNNIYINDIKTIIDILNVNKRLENIIKDLYSINIFNINIIKDFNNLFKDINIDLIRYNILKLEYINSINNIENKIDNNIFKNILLKEDIKYDKEIITEDLNNKLTKLELIDLLSEKKLINIIYELQQIEINIINNDKIKRNDIIKDYNDLSENNIIDLNKIKYEINNIVKNNKIKYDFLNNKITKIGSSYGEYKSDLYRKLTKKPPKTNRGRKPKDKKKSIRKKQGNGMYFTSQITFTILSDETFDEKNKLYHIKIFVNGRIQIPFVTNEDINIIMPYINMLKQYFDDNINFIKVDKDKEVKLEYLTSIMRNYKFKVINQPDSLYNIDLNKFENILREQKEIINNSENINIFPISEIKYNSERYPAITIKFDTNIQTYPDKKPKQKRATIKIFSSIKINIDGSQNRQDSLKMKNFLLDLIKENKNKVLYIK